MSGIPLDWLVNITSSGVRDTFSISKLPTLLVTNNVEIPSKQWSKFYDSTSLGKALGINTQAKLFADNYFSFTNKKASRADVLNVLYYNNEAKPCALIGGKANDIEKLNTLSGNFNLTIGGITRQVECDFQNAVSYTDIATKLQECIRIEGAPQVTILNVTSQSDVSLDVKAGELNKTSVGLNITTNASTLQNHIAQEAVATYDEATKTITAKAKGNTTLTFDGLKDAHNPVRCVINIEVTEKADDKSLIISKADVKITEITSVTLKVETNAKEYEVINGDNTTISYNKDTGLLQGLKRGATTLSFKAKYSEEAESAQIDYRIGVTDTLGLIIEKQVQQISKARYNKLAEASNEFALAQVEFNTQTSGFIIKSGVSGANTSIEFASAPSSGTDIHTELGLTEAESASIVEGLDAIPTFTDLLNAIEVENGAYYVIQFDFSLSDDEMLEFCKFINSSNDRFMGIINTQDKKIVTQEGALSKYQGYNGVLVEYTKDKTPLGLSAGIISSLDFSVTNGNTNVAFNDVSSFEAISLTTKAELNTLEANLANSILTFSQIGQSTTWYGMGNILGTKTNSANVYIANSYMKFQLQFSLANMFNAQPMVGLRGANNETLIRSYLESVFSGCVNNGIIVEGATLTTTEQNSLQSAFASQGETAITQCEKNGYFFVIDSVDLVTKTIKIVSAYVANTPAKKIVINNYILGA